MKAYMVRKAASVKDWEDAKKCIEIYSGEKAKREVVIENLMRMDEHGIWHCIKVTARGSKVSVLVNSEGYDYARYTAVIKK